MEYISRITVGRCRKGVVVCKHKVLKSDFEKSSVEYADTYHRHENRYGEVPRYGLHMLFSNKLFD